MRRILFFAIPLGLAGCALPSRKTVSPYANAPSLVDVAALTSFKGVVPLVTVPKDTSNWPDSVTYAVSAARKIKPDATFRVTVTAPPGGPEEQQQQMKTVAPTAASVADAIVADGVSPSNVSLSAAGAPIPDVPPPSGPEVLVFAK